MLRLLAFVQLALYLTLYSIFDLHAQIHFVLLLFLALSLLFFGAIYKLKKEHISTREIVFWAIAFRLVCALDVGPASNMLSDDIYRYIWEGQVVAAGMSPYAHAPNSEALGSIKANYPALWESVAHKKVSAIYPPFAQYIFSIIPPYLAAFKLFFFLCEILSIYLLLLWLRRREFPENRLLLYAWLPLPVIEICSSAHLEGMMIPFVLLGLLLFEMKHTQYRLAGIASLSLATLIKFVAVVPLGFCIYSLFLKSKRTVLSAVSLSLGIAFALYFPFLDTDLSVFSGLSEYASRWRFNGGVFRMLEFLLLKLEVSNAASMLKMSSTVLISVTGLYVFHRKKDIISSSTSVFLLVLILAPVVYPWYLLWFAPFIPLLSTKSLRYAALAFCCSVLLSYEVLSHPETWKLNPSILALELLIPLLAYFFFRNAEAKDRIGSNLTEQATQE